MQPAVEPVPQIFIADIWRAFTKAGNISREHANVMDPAVLQSWRRCVFRLNPHARPRLSPMKGQALASILRTQSSLVSISTPVMEDIHQFVEGSDCAILLADGAACIMKAVGDDTAVANIDSLGLGRGTYWSEGQLGTNAMGIVLASAMPAQVVGAEHYFKLLHAYTTSAAPIHDVRGRVIGLLGVFGPVSQNSSHTLGLVMSAARAISNQMQAEWSLQEANRRLSEVNTIMGAISDGVIAWDAEGEITHVNACAGDMLKLNTRAVLGRPLHDVLQLPPVIVEAVENHHELRNVEVIFRINSHSARALVSLRPIFEASAEPVGYIALLSPIEQVRQLIQQQAGTDATLTLDDVYGQSPAMRQVVRQARIAARGTAPVLLRGEGGVGKNHLAQAIHNDGTRAEKPFLAINCRAIPHELMAGELLGREKDLVTQGRPSKFELADGGTLLLDQIESLSLEMQAALLQVIETGQVMRLGGTHPISTDVRIIVATSTNLEKLVADGSFMPHLYYRFGVFNITIPPLRERAEDMPLLAERFLARITRRDERATWIDDEALGILRRYPWPGNVRELEGVLERAILQSEDGVIHATHLPEAVRNGRVLVSSSPNAEPVLSIAEAEREAIIRAGWACRGHVTEMAQLLQIGRTTLWRKMRHHNITPEQFKE